MRQWYVVAAVAVVLMTGEPRLSAQKQGQLFISLTSPSGQPVEELQASEVDISEDGVACTVLHIEPIDWPIKLQVLVDNGKVNTEPINALRNGLKGLFDQIPDGVETSLYTTAPQSRLIVKPTTDRQALIDGIGRLGSDSGAGAFFDALSEAVARIDKDKTPQFPVILMVGSDVGRIDVLPSTFQRMRADIITHAVTVHIVLTQSDTREQTGVQMAIALDVTKLSGASFRV